MAAAGGCAIAVVDVLTINLWGANGPADDRVEALVAYLRADRPAVLLLQEVEALADDRPSLAAEIAGTLDYAALHEDRTGRDGRRGEGLAILADHTLHPAPTVALPDAPDDHPRGAVQADVHVDGRPVRVVCTHLSWRLDAGAYRAAQARALTDAVRGGPEAVVLGGDLNDVPGSATLEALTGPPLHLADCCAIDDGWTFHPANPYAHEEELLRRRVDHVLVGGLQLVAASVVLDGRTGPVVSDHYGVRITIAPTRTPT